MKEVLITRRLEAELSKQRILELYLNSIEWGDGVWGAEAAARRYFKKPAADLTATESALLAAAIANPHIMDPAHPSARLRRRQQMIMRRMGAVTPPPVVAEPPAPPAGLPDGPAVVPLPDQAASRRPHRRSDRGMPRVVDLGNNYLYLLTLTRPGTCPYSRIFSVP